MRRSRSRWRYRRARRNVRLENRRVAGGGRRRSRALKISGGSGPRHHRPPPGAPGRGSCAGAAIGSSEASSYVIWSPKVVDDGDVLAHQFLQNIVSEIGRQQVYRPGTTSRIELAVEVLEQPYAWFSSRAFSAIARNSVEAAQRLRRAVIKLPRATGPSSGVAAAEPVPSVSAKVSSISMSSRSWVPRCGELDDRVLVMGSPRRRDLRHGEMVVDEKRPVWTGRRLSAASGARPSAR